MQSMRSLPLLLSAMLGLSRKRVALSVVVIDAFVTGLAEAGARHAGLRDASVIRDPGASPHAARRVTAKKQPRMLASKCNRDSSIRSPLARALPPRSCQKECHGLHGMKNGKIIGTA
jgi:hypothetical protein